MKTKFMRSRHPSPGLEVGHKIARHLPGTAVLKLKLAKMRSQRQRPPYFRRFLSQNAIFIRTPKNASTSLCEFVFPGFSAEQWPLHVSADYYRAIHPAFYASATVIAPMREPISRLISAFNWYRHSTHVEQERAILRTAIGGKRTFGAFMNYLAEAPDLDNLEILQWHHFRRQVDFITARDGQPIIDYLFPIEDMSLGLEKLQELFGTTGQVNHRNVSRGTKLSCDIPDNVLAYYADDTRLWESVITDRLQHIERSTGR